MQRVLFASALISTLAFGCRHQNATGDADVGADRDDSGSSSSHGADSGADAASDAFMYVPGADSGEDAASDAFRFSDDDAGSGGSNDSGGVLPTFDANADVGTLIPLGGSCTGDASCASGRCVRVSSSAGPTCVETCSGTGDCAAGSYCAQVPGADRVCAPRSTSLCATCTADADCGVLSEVCATAPGDTTRACHTDCSHDPTACPTAYSCNVITTPGGDRSVCVPTVSTCAAATGCTSAATCGAGQDCCGGVCTRIDSAANCTGCGIRCDMGDGCCGGSCRSLTDTLNCLGCGVQCLGSGTTGDASCDGVMGCRLTCRGEHWDANGSAADGCEVLDTVPPGHNQAGATSRGSFQCFDASSSDSFSGHIVSDARFHLPTISGIDMASGSAPDYWTVTASGPPPGPDTGVACINDVSATITTTGGSSDVCYRLSVITNVGTYTADVSGAGTATASHGAGAYGSGTMITFKIEKTCSSATTHGDISYTVSYHL
jgi:hypothetical protein